MPYGPYVFRRPSHRIPAQQWLPSAGATPAIIPLATAVCVSDATLDLTAPTVYTASKKKAQRVAA
jgi:hypothetical protein